MRITTAHIENLTDWINHEKGYPLEAYTGTGGVYKANAGHIKVIRYNGSCPYFNCC